MAASYVPGCGWIGDVGRVLKTMTENTNAFVSGLPVTMETFPQILEQMEERIRKREGGGYISITNTESMYHAMRIENHRRYIEDSDFSLCDGIGVVIAGFAWGEKVPRRNGPILMLHACEYGLDKGWRHYFYGGTDGVPELLEQRLKERFPGLQVVGTHSPPFREHSEDEKLAIIEDIRAAQPDIVWVGLGLLKQERWIAEMRETVGAPWMVGVGAAFDYHAGTVPWAPEWMQAIGMEWLYRTVVQPKLRIKRYIWSYQFMFESIFQAVSTRIVRVFRN